MMDSEHYATDNNEGEGEASIGSESTIGSNDESNSEDESEDDDDEYDDDPIEYTNGTIVQNGEGMQTSMLFMPLALIHL